MSPAVIPIDTFRLSARRNAQGGHWALLEIEIDTELLPFGILLADDETNQLYTRCRTTADVAELFEPDEQQTDILDWLEEDLRNKGLEEGAVRLFEGLESSLSSFLRISDRTALAYSGSPQRAVDRLFDEFVDSEIRAFETHLPLYGLRAAATKFGEGMAIGESAGDEEAWIRVRPAKARLTPDMFVAHVVGRSMEPLIPDDSLCIFRAGVKGTRQGKYLLIEKFGESDFASRYTVKKYTSRKRQAGDSEWEHESIRLEPVNSEFEAFELGPDQFRVIGEFVEVLGPASE